MFHFLIQLYITVVQFTKQEVMAENNWQNSIRYEWKKTIESSLFLLNFSSNDRNEKFSLCLSRKGINVQFTSAILATRTDKTLSHRSYDSLPYSGKGSNSRVPKKTGASQNVP